MERIALSRRRPIWMEPRPIECDRRDFSRRLRSLMSARGLSVRSLLVSMGETGEKTQKVYAWLNGERLPSFEMLLLLHRSLRCEWSELMGE